jgi:aspartate/methionine/tyrosine aminotransferase
MTPTTALGRAVAERGRAWLAPDPDSSGLADMSGDILAGSTPASVRAAVADALGRHLGDHYTRRPGIAPLCRAVAEQLNDAGVPVDADKDVVIAGGPQEARFVAVRALAPGRAVLVPAPAPLPFYADAARFAGAELRGFDPAGALPEAPGALLILPSPNPATGRRYDEATLGRLAAWAAANDMRVIADETAAPLLRPELAHTPFAARPGMAERTLTLGSFAAVPGLGAWNVAWFAGARPLAVSVRDLKQAITICSPAASQYAALAAVDGPADLLAQHVERVEAVAGLLDRLGVPYEEPETVAFVVADVAALGGGAAVAAACARHGVLVADGAAFGDPGRIRITAASDGFAEGLAALEAALAELSRQEVQR